LGLLLLFSCSSKQVVTNEKTVHDTLVVTKTVRLRDTTIVVKESTASLKLPVSELNEKEQFHKNGQATLSIRKVHDTIYAKATCEKLELQLHLKDSLISVLHNRIEQTLSHMPRDNTGNSETWIMKFIKGIGFVVLILLSIAGIFFWPNTF